MHAFIGHSLVASPLANTVKEVGGGPVSFTLSVEKHAIDEGRKPVSTIQLLRLKLYRHFSG